MKWIKVFSPATIGNIGPGFDVLGLAIKGLGDTVEARKIPKGIKIVSIKSKAKLTRDPAKNTASIAAAHVLKLMGERGGLEMKITKGLPIGSGLGSSAASAAAGAFAANYLYGEKLNKEQLILAATKAEEVVSGGFFADNTAPALLGGATLTRCCVPLDITKLGSIKRLKIILAIPDIVVLTKDARAMLPDKISMADFVYNMANTALITAAFAKNDYSLFARSLNDRVIEPVRSKLIDGFDRVKKHAMQAGADGVAISGSGPTIFAITDNLRKARHIEKQMVLTFNEIGIATMGYITSVDSVGTQIVQPD
jgi:homoserine kinase